MGPADNVSNLGNIPLANIEEPSRCKKVWEVVKKILIVATIILVGTALFFFNPGFFLAGIGLGIACRALILKEGKLVKEAFENMPLIAKAGLVAAVVLGGFLALATTLAFASLFFAASVTVFVIHHYTKESQKSHIIAV